MKRVTISIAAYNTKPGTDLRARNIQVTTAESSNQDNAAYRRGGYVKATTRESILFSTKPFSFLYVL